MKTPACVEMKNRIQADIMRDYESVPREDWSRRQAEELAKSRSPIAGLWRRLKPAQGRRAVCVAEKQADYAAGSGAKK